MIVIWLVIFWFIVCIAVDIYLERIEKDEVLNESHIEKRKNER